MSYTFISDIFLSDAFIYEYKWKVNQQLRRIVNKLFKECNQHVSKRFNAGISFILTTSFK